MLASGGSRGLAHIGVIEVLEECGYHITSVSGASMGALVGGIYAAGGLGEFKKWMKQIDKMRVFSLMDFTLSKDGLVKGEKIIKELEKLVPDVSIESLPIPFTAVATDILHRQEVVFDHGSLFAAIRASISMPSIFRPYRLGKMVLIDGGVINPIPLNRISRTQGDILVGVDLNAPYIEKKKEKKKFNLPLGEDDSLNYVTILNESSSLMIQTNSERSLSLYKPDITISIPKNAFSTMEFYKYEEIVEMGRGATIKELRRYES